MAHRLFYAFFEWGLVRAEGAALFLFLPFPAVIGSYGIGRLVDRFGPKKTLSWVLASWIVLLVSMIVAPSRSAFWIVGALIGLIYGGVFTAGRPLRLRLVSSVEAGRFFRLMGLSSRGADV